MAEFIISIDDSLAPGIIATASLEGKTPEEVVGPYYTGPIPPQFNADGTPYVAPTLDDNDTNPPVVEEEV